MIPVLPQELAAERDQPPGPGSESPGRAAGSETARAGEPTVHCFCKIVF